MNKKEDNPIIKKVSKKPSEDPRITELTLALQRERADSVNIRRQQEEQLNSLRSIVTGSIVGQLLPVVDNFERSLIHVPDNLKDNDYIKGIYGIVKQFQKVFSDIGVERIKTNGEIFDPKYHEAVSMDEAEGGTKEIISEELQAGYILGDQVIRHAMVKVRMEK
jgi:molecular chaperone GrpE